MTKAQKQTLALLHKRGKIERGTTPLLTTSGIVLFTNTDGESMSIEPSGLVVSFGSSTTEQEQT